jgi:GNAT acetyltransferase-like protein
MGFSNQLTVTEYAGPGAEWDGLMARAAEPSLVQSWAYGEAKARTSAWKIERVVVRDGEKIVALVQAQTRLLPVVNRGLVWVNRAPVAIEAGEGSDPAAWSRLLEALRQHWVVKRGLLLRVALPVAADKAGSFESAGFHPISSPAGWASTRVDLAPDLEVLRKNLDSKWRNQLGKAERSGLELEVASTPEAVKIFCADYETFLASRGIETSVTPALLAALAECAEGAGRPQVFSVRKDGQALGAIYLARFGRTAEYLAAVSRDEGRPFNAANFLLWSALGQAKTEGCTQFDLGGMHPETTPKGIFHFKAGLSGAPYRYADPLEAGGDLVVNRLMKKFIPR